MQVIERIQELTRPTGEEALLQVKYPTPRVHVPVKPAAAVMGVVMSLLVLWAVVQVRGPDVAEEDAPVWENVATATDVPERVVVAVVGEVANPGLVTLNQGSRVADALDIAQPLDHADLLQLNLAQVLVDGQQLHVVAIGEGPAVPGGDGGGAVEATGQISLNGASAAELVTLPGVGEATAAAIIAHREANGPFQKVEDLMQVKGIGPAKFEAIAPLVGL
ncbi:ComEA family DNA-binding protein [Corynebacterium pseudogenitalium]|uniref:ComEA family DNA-binding protein n=1 Tax=Corynebacterium pseudogenitalium TaxID=38303 RepID=UPI00210AAA1B|nr:ComEA family DNA-binding protein [Corynebacterium pseudogenitalium]UUA86785.1 ComEA family DNA-binding protein [Corynebacterium pseudogenitalium]